LGECFRRSFAGFGQHLSLTLDALRQVSQDSPAFGGDYTLDYNYEAQFYGVFGSNHAEQSASYFAPVVAYQPVAAKLARLIAGRLRLTGAACNASLHFPAGGAPWGFQDIDTHIYMRESSAPSRTCARVCLLLTRAVPCRLER
jgi:hypothetical protein